MKHVNEIDKPKTAKSILGAVDAMGILNSRDAMFDLLDNAIDAAASDHETGQISVEADDRSSGIVVMNSCLAPVKPLHKILELYTSEKHDKDDVGENEMRRNQGVLALANLSFLISKNRDKYSFGIVATSLQAEDESWLPSFEFASRVGSDLEQELFSTLEGQIRLRQCVSSYGKSFLDGVRRLSKVMLHMDNSKLGWRQYPHVFCLLMHDLKHGENLVPQDRVVDLLNQIKTDLPKHYLHIPKNLVISVETDVITFNYWPPRLVELTTFDLWINKSAPMEEDSWWQYLAKSNDLSEGYPIRIYIGFDAERAVKDGHRSTASLYIYSQKYGRLVRVSPDARAEINVCKDETEYCQGLTIILDDHGGYLPLNSTDHDVAFFEHVDGVIHRANLFGCINAVTRFYCRYFKECYFSNQGIEISDALRALVPRVKEAIALDMHEYTPISQCVFNTFNEFLYKQSSVKSNHISRSLHWKDVVLQKGKDNILCFTNVDDANDHVLSDAVVPKPVPNAAPISVKSENFFDDKDDQFISSATSSLGQRSNIVGQSPPARKRPRSSASEKADEQTLNARVALLESELAKMKEFVLTQDKLGKEIRRLKRDMARQNKVIRRLDARLGGIK